MSQNTLFLETTIQIERVAGNRMKQAGLRRELAPYRLISSTYVLGEFLRTLVKDSIRLHRLVVEHPHLDDVMTTIGQHPNRREASRMSLIWGSIMRLGWGSDRQDSDARADLLDRLARYIEFSLLNRFMAGIDELYDGTGCGLGRERPEIWQTKPVEADNKEVYKLRSQCVRQMPECCLGERLVEWQPELRVLASGLSKEQDPALIRMGELAEQILDDPTIALGRNCTWYLGDLIIALELPAGIPLYTTNRRHFTSILNILGKPLHSPGAV
ncbi:MAG: hypothetical protein JXA42_08695 [Anaerolineales bacterium]|nr:hypothetical protein [Anaerolineales bacterium]